MKSLHILLVEDNRVNQIVACKMLERIGHSVDCADNGAAALTAFQDRTYDLILMDVQMPQMDGFEATRRIRQLEIPTGKHIQIIALTAHALKSDREQCLAAGMDNYLSKPLRSRDLYEMLQTVFPS
jgi:CheY-like chemotaxis protein